MSDWKARHNTDAGLSRQYGKGFSPSQLPAPTLLHCPYSPCVQSHALTSVCTLTIPHTGSYTLVWTEENTTHWQKWVALLLQLLCLTQVVTQISCQGQLSIMKNIVSHCFITDLSTNTDPIHTTTQQPNFTVSFLSEFCCAWSFYYLSSLCI